MRVEFFAAGLPAPQGSKTGFVVNGHVRMKESSAKVKPWRSDVRDSALLALPIGWTPFHDAVAVDLKFWMPRPKSHPKTMYTFPTTNPDIDKLVRSTLDALTSAGVYRDDSLVVDLMVRERYVHPLNLARPGDSLVVGATVAVFDL